jgi:hypothetical protein
MKIERVYIACHSRAMHRTRCCVASIRHWYSDLAISLIKDEIGGPFDTRDMQEYWGVDVLPTGGRSFGGGIIKLEVLLLQERQRCLILDDDIVFLGRVIDRLERFDEDFVVASHGGPLEQLERHYFDLRRLHQFDPEFCYHKGAFNCGQYVATTGILEWKELEAFLTTKSPRRVVRPDIFKGSDQGLLNYLLLKRWQDGRIYLRHEDFMWWSEWLEPGRIAVEDLERQRDFSVLLHWAGPKPATIAAMRHAEILRFFHERYFSRIPDAVRRQIENGMDAAARRQQRLRAAALKILQRHAS